MQVGIDSMEQGKGGGEEGMRAMLWMSASSSGRSLAHSVVALVEGLQRSDTLGGERGIVYGIH